MQVTITRDETEDQDGEEVTLSVDINVLPAEYEDGHCYAGGVIEINETYLNGQRIELSESETERVLDALYRVVKIPNHYYRGDY